MWMISTCSVYSLTILQTPVTKATYHWPTVQTTSNQFTLNHYFPTAYFIIILLCKSLFPQLFGSYNIFYDSTPESTEMTEYSYRTCYKNKKWTLTSVKSVQCTSSHHINLTSFLILLFLLHGGLCRVVSFSEFFFKQNSRMFFISFSKYYIQSFFFVNTVRTQV